MGSGNNGKQHSWYFSAKFLDHLDPYILLIHEEPTEVEDKLLLRFQNGFGVEILQPFLSGEKSSFFRVLALKFMGASMEDFKPVEYLPIPKVTWVDNQEDLTHLCQQVAQLPGAWSAVYHPEAGFSAVFQD